MSEAAAIQKLVADLHARFPDLPQQPLVRALNLAAPLHRGRGWEVDDLRDLVAAWQECYEGVPQEAGDAMWEIYLQRIVTRSPGLGLDWDDLCERVAHALGLKNGRWAPVKAVDGRLGLGGQLMARSKDREFCLEAWWSAFLLELLARKVVRVRAIVEVDYAGLGAFAH